MERAFSPWFPSRPHTWGFAPGWYENALPALCISIGIWFEGPEARFIPAWRSASGQRTHNGFQRPEARLIPAWRNGQVTGGAVVSRSMVRAFSPWFPIIDEIPGLRAGLI